MQHMQNDDGYTGRDNLEVMQEAVNYNRWLCRLVTSRAAKNSRVLDFGAGSGTFAKMIAGEGFNVSCVEPDEILRQQLGMAGLNSIASSDLLAPASFDFIYTFNVLEHIEHDAAEIRKLARALSPGGWLLIFVPAFQLLYSSMDRKVRHLRRYRLTPLCRMVQDSGLQITHARYADSIGFFASIAYKLVGSSDGSINPTSVRFYDRIAFPLSLAVDRITDRLLGKNVLVVARKMPQ